MWPAVPSVSGRSRRRSSARGAHDRAASVGLLVGERARVEQQAAVLDAADDRRVAGAQRARRARRRRPGRGRARPTGPSSSSSGSAPPPTRAVRRDRPSPPVASRQRAGARAASVVGSPRRASRAPGSRAARAPGRGRGAASPRARRARACRSAPRARAGGARHAATASARADEQPGLRAAEQLVAGEADERRAGAHRAAHRRLVGEQPARSSASTPEPTSSITGDAEPAQRLDLDLLDEPERAEVRRVRAQDRAGRRRRARARSRRSRVRFVVPTSTSRAPGLRHDLGDPERAADLDQLPARDDDLAPAPASAAAASSTAAAQLLTASAASAPVSSRSSASTWSWREPRSPVVEVDSRFE